MRRSGSLRLSLLTFLALGTAACGRSSIVTGAPADGAVDGGLLDGPVLLDAAPDGAVDAGVDGAIDGGPPVEAVSLAIEPPRSVLPLGGSASLRAILLLSDGGTEDVTEAAAWVSADPEIATVDAGRVEARAAGLVTLEASRLGFVARATVEVLEAAPVALTVLPPSAETRVGGTLTFDAELTLDDGTTLVVTESAAWESEDAGVLEVTSPGAFRAVGSGADVVRASFAGLTASATVTVGDAPLERIEVSPRDPSLALGATQRFTALGVATDGSTFDLSASVVWSSSDPAVLAIGATGEGDARAAGTAIVSATFEGVEGISTVTVSPARLVGLAITPEGPSLGVGDEVSLTLSGTFDDGSVQDLTESAAWSSDAPDVAQVGNTPGRRGVVTGLAIGEALVGASFGGLSAEVRVTVNDAALVALVVAPATATLPVGGDLRFVATGTFADGSERDLSGEVAWTSSEPSVAVIASAGARAGTASGVAAGSATITATRDGVSVTASLTVTAARLVSLAVTPVDATTTAGLRTAYTATGTFSDGAEADLTALALWSTADADVATVSNAPGSEGQLNAVGAGTTTVSASFEGVTGSTSVTVVGPRLLEVQVSPVTFDAEAGRRIQYTAVAIFSDGERQNVTGRASWSSSAASVASVDGRGRVDTLAAGVTTLTATFDGLSGSATLTVTDAVLVEVQVTPVAPTLAAGQLVRFQAVAIFSDGTSRNVTGEATWSSSAPATLTVSNDPRQRGLGTAVAAGSAEAQAVFEGVTGSTTVTVTAATVVDVSVTPVTFTAAVGEDQRFQAVAIFSDGTSRNVTVQATWTSTAPSVAQVSNRPGQQGLVTALAAGTATLRATFEGVSGSASVTVTAATLTTVQVTPFAPSLAAGSTLRFQAVAIFSDGTSRNVTGEATWLSSDATVASSSNGIGSRGLATALAAGTTTLEAVYLGTRGSVVLTVTAATIDRIQVTPFVPTIPAGFGAQLQATAIFTDGSTRDVTGLATWTSTAPAAASVSNAIGSRGRLTALAAGSGDAEATYLGVSGRTTFTITGATLTTIDVTPATASVAVGARTAFEAEGSFSDGSTLDITAFVTWGAANLRVADVSNAAGSRGEATGFAPGMTAVTATRGAVSGSATLTVTP